MNRPNEEIANADTNWFQMLYISTYIVGFVLLISSLFLRIERPAVLYIVAYTVLLITMGMVATKLYIKMNANLASLQAFTIINYISNFISYLGPIFLIIVLLSVSLYLYSRYRDNINNKHVSEQFFSFNFISTILMTIQFGILLYALSSKEFTEKNQVPNMYKYLLYFIGTINLYAVLIIWYILTSYTTDGFQLLKSMIRSSKTLTPSS